ncbi:MAG: hypothetical protein VYE68_08480 [Acidobacteriota bacterium]|nr:hypothetical protein [Acidobacteriota bacterium]
MSELRIGRALGASLHQAIDEVLPTRLEFYESWLTPKRVRDGTLGRAKITAVFSFLRQEPEGYDLVMERAGRYTAEWTLETMSGIERATVSNLPYVLRVRSVLRIGGRFIRGLHVDGRLRRTSRRGVTVVTIEHSLFCDQLAPGSAPRCRFYGALLERCFESFGLRRRAEITRCLGTGDRVCEIMLETVNHQEEPPSCVPAGGAIP